MTNGLSKLGSQVAAIQAYYNINIVDELNKRISKVSDDTANGKITFKDISTFVKGFNIADSLIDNIITSVNSVSEDDISLMTSLKSCNTFLRKDKDAVANYTITSPTFIGDLNGNADTSTKLHTAISINGIGFDGTVNITTPLWGVPRNMEIQDHDSSHSGTVISVNGSSNITLKLPDTITAELNGNAATATKLKTSRTLWGNSFDGTSDVSGNLLFDKNNFRMASSFTDVWNDGTNTHPWYGYDHNQNTGVFSTTITDYFGLTLKTVHGNISMVSSGNVGIGTTSPAYKYMMILLTERLHLRAIQPPLS